MTQIMGLTTDGLRGISPLSVMRNAIGTGIAGEQAAARSFGSGLLISGIVTPEEDITEADAQIIKAGLQAKMGGVQNAGDIAVVNRKLNFSPWSMTNEDAQFVQSREFQVIEFARMFGIPPHLLGAAEKQTSWGTGVAEQNVGLARYTLMPWTSRVEESLTSLLPRGTFAEFDYSGLLQGSPKEEIELLIKQKEAGILTVDEVRHIRNLPPLTAAQKAETAPPPPAPAEPPQETPSDE
jgi:HK97 family phage portal protein